MPRTPSMTVADAAAALGPIETLRPTGETRALLRKWAVACGNDSRVIYRLSLADLMNMYAGAPLPVPTAAPVADKPSPAQKTAAEALAEAIKVIAGGTVAMVDETRVSEMIRDALAGFKPEPGVKVTRLEIAGPTGIHHIDGTIHHLTPKIIRTASLGHPVMLVGPAGCGKTTIGMHVADALGLPFFITSTVFDTHELMGFVDGYGKYHRTAFREAFENGGVWVADEIDAWDAAALLAANSALANGRATFPDNDKPVKRHANFRIIATANTFGHGADRVYVGRNELDAASLDRFATYSIDYDDGLETAFCGGNLEWLANVKRVRKACRDKNIRHVVSSRAIIMGTQALANGDTWADCEELYIFKGMSQTDREKIR